jgi:hypothetical protein
MSPAKVLNRRSAGKNHAVVTVVNGDDRYCTQPCPECPWRKDQTGEFPPEASKISANTANDMNTHTFGCHMAGTEKPATCAGFILNGSIHNLTVRLKVITGKIDLSKISNGGHELHKDYRSMAIANGVKKNDPAIKECR